MGNAESSLEAGSAPRWRASWPRDFATEDAGNRRALRTEDCTQAMSDFLVVVKKGALSSLYLEACRFGA